MVFRTEDGACDDSFEVYLNDRTLVYRYVHGRAGEAFPLHRAPLDPALTTGRTIRIKFLNRALDSYGRVAAFFVRLEQNGSS